MIEVEKNKQIFVLLIKNSNFFFLNLAQQLKLNDDRLTVIGDKGYCSVRSTHCKFLEFNQFLIETLLRCISWCMVL